MGWRFRQSFTIVPGLRLNLSSRGLSASIGSAPFTVNLGPNGVRGTASIPGTGLSYAHHLHGPRAQDPGFAHQPALPHATHVDQFVNTAPIEEVHSASTEILTSATLADVKQLICAAEQQYQEVTRDLDLTRTAKLDFESRYRSWKDGLLLRRLFKNKFAERRENFERETAHVAELEEQQKLSTISAHIEIESKQAELYFRFRDEFAALSECTAIWDIKSYKKTDKFHERTIAEMRIDRERVRFDLGACDLIRWDQKVPHLHNAKGGDLYLYPGFILYRAARQAFSLIEYHDIVWEGRNSLFIESESVPDDCEVLGSTWAKANKDGSRDRRFADNYQIPTVEYGQLILKSSSGPWEEFQFSNLGKMVNWVKALTAFCSSFAQVDFSTTEKNLGNA